MAVSMSPVAYAKMVLHACKHVSAAVSGVLLGSLDNDEVNVVDSVPLFHATLNLAPMLEIALLQLDEYCKSKGLAIVGYYQANEELNANSMDAVATSIGDKIRQKFPNAFVLVVDNTKMHPASIKKELACKAYFSDAKSANGWRLRENKSLPATSGEGSDVAVGDAVKLSTPKTLQATANLVQAEQYLKLVDFDAHLDDVSLDYMNAALGDHIKAAVTKA